MADPQMTGAAEPLTGDPLIDAMTSGYRWILDGSRTVDWSISDGFSGEFWTDPATAVEYVRQALTVYSHYANISFSYLGNFSSPTAAASAGSEMNLSLDGAGRFMASNAVWAIGFFPTTSFNSQYPGAGGDVFLNINSAANSLPSYDPGSAGWALILHEIGHALGLKHPHDSGGTGRPTFNDLNIGEADVDFVSVMSYNDDQNWNLIQFDPATPMIADVLALQALYGPNMNTNTGNTSYTLSQSGMYVTLWDAGGIDQVTAAASNVGWEIYLPDDVLSSRAPQLAGYAGPYAEINGPGAPQSLYWLLGNIEDAVGSNFDDYIYGSRLDNFMFGEGGNDTIEGWGGSDFIRGGAGNDRLVGAELFDNMHGNTGSDTLFGGGGGDWVVGGQDGDLLNGEAGDDIIYGNLASDTCNGGDGNDSITAGQLDDLVFGGAGNDWLGGDRGADTLSGGAGADTFRIFVGVEVDRITDFNRAEGDKILFEGPGNYTASQVGADVVLDLGGGNVITLVGVAQSSLTDGWIVRG